ncbi:DUF3291 domain-containing protein [Sediminicola luteus]|uniref:Uncharacterized protein n=1 Tax=Sediminicola luteus TaxID=319238 RepID=A0A2A4G7N6_9FLAO|nr:DUF3291 domain-containing protein [Sediminicola luteus]PCE64006.1 hypothetical protein B7P33_12215 [Sediminicola luteus]
MILSITYIRLKSLWHFFELSRYALHSVRQLKKGPCKKYKSTGFGLHHYTMSLWESEEDLKEFATSGAHKKAMQKSAKIAKEIHVLSTPHSLDKLPTWTEAKTALKNDGRISRW